MPRSSSPANWDDASYLSLNPDVALAIERGQLSDGWYHYVTFGRQERLSEAVPLGRGDGAYSRIPVP